MPSPINVVVSALLLLPALLLLLLGASGAPADAPTESASAGEASGEGGGEEEASDLLSTWKALADMARQHSKQFEDEFYRNATILDSYRASSFPVKCPESNFSKEACYHRLAQGLLSYMVLLKHVEKEYPNNTLLAAARLYSMVLIQQIKEKMKGGHRVTAPSSSQEAQLLKEFDHPHDSYHRKMTAHSVLHHLRKFLADGKRAIAKRERAKKKTEPVFYKALSR